MTDPRAIADALITAERDRTPIAPFTHASPYLHVDTAYKAQALVVEHRLDAGERVIGAKLGFTSKVKRLALGIHEPVYGRLTSRMASSRTCRVAVSYSRSMAGQPRRESPLRCRRFI